MIELGYIKRNGRHLHRQIAERLLGRPLRPGEIVHHLDGNSRNNDPSNIQVLANQAEHARIHRLGLKLPPKTHCKNGHALTPANVVMTSIGRRRCLTCARRYDNEWHKAQRRTRGLRRPGAKPGVIRSRDWHGRFAQEHRK